MKARGRERGREAEGGGEETEGEESTKGGSRERWQVEEGADCGADGETKVVRVSERGDERDGEGGVTPTGLPVGQVDTPGGEREKVREKATGESRSSPSAHVRSQHCTRLRPIHHNLCQP